MGITTGLSKSEDVLLVAAADVATTRDVLRADLAALRARIEQVTGQWEGRGHRAFRSAVESWQLTADRVIGALDEFEAQLHASETAYSDTDDSVSVALGRYAGMLG